MGMEVALRAKEVERQTGNLVLTKERTFLPGCPNIRLNQVPIHHLALQVVLEAGDAGVCHHCLKHDAGQDEGGHPPLSFHC